MPPPARRSLGGRRLRSCRDRRLRPCRKGGCPANHARPPDSPSNSSRISPSLPVTFSPTDRPRKSFRCNIYRSPRKCCEQKTYGQAKSFRCNTYKKYGVTSFKPNISLCPCPVASPVPPQLSPVFRTLFQVPYPTSPVFAALTKTPGVWGHSSHFGTCRRADVSMCRHFPIPFLFTFLRTLLHSQKTQPVSFQALPHSLPETTRVGGGGPFHSIAPQANHACN